MEDEERERVARRLFGVSPRRPLYLIHDDELVAVVDSLLDRIEELERLIEELGR